MNYTTKLADSLRRSVKELHPESIAIPFSGGLDSSVIAFLIKEHGPKLYVVSVGDSHDLKSALSSSEILGLELSVVSVTEDRIESSIPSLARLINSTEPLVLSFELPLYFVAESCRERMIISGQGADELFGGYARYLKMSYKHLREALERDLNILLNEGILRERSIARHFGKELFYPFLTECVIEFAKTIPAELKVREGVRKFILRECAKALGLPESITEREKKAVQYSSGIMPAIEKLAKKSGLKLREYIKFLAQQ